MSRSTRGRSLRRTNRIFCCEGIRWRAVARPQQHFAYSEGSTDVLDLAIALLLGIAQNHPFQQGNKRTAFVAFVAFLNRNGYDLDAPDEGVPVATAIIDVLEKRSGPDRFRDFIAPFVSPFDAL